MANVVEQFIDPADGYDNYTSNIIWPAASKFLSKQTHGIFQLDWTTGSVTLEGRVSPDAPWMVVITAMTADTIQEVLLYNEMRLVSTLIATAWLGQTK